MSESFLECLGTPQRGRSHLAFRFFPDANMYLSNKLFRSTQPSLNLNLPEASTPQEAQVGPRHLSAPLQAFLFPSLNLNDLQAPEVVVTTESGIPRDAGGAIDYSALVNLLRDTQSLQDQADILYILFKDK